MDLANFIIKIKNYTKDFFNIIQKKKIKQILVKDIENLLNLILNLYNIKNYEIKY